MPKSVQPRDVRVELVAKRTDHAAATLSRKIVAAAAVVDTVRLGMEAVGGASFSTSAGIERLYRPPRWSLPSDAGGETGAVHRAARRMIGTAAAFGSVARRAKHSTSRVEGQALRPLSMK